MSKKQREKVEEEVNYHQTQNRLRGNSASGTSPDPWPNPDSTGSGESCPGGPVYPQPGFPPYPDLGPGQGYSAPNQNPFYGSGGGGGPGPGQTQTQQFDEFVDSTTPNTTTPGDYTRSGGTMQPGPDTDAQHLQQGESPGPGGDSVDASVDVRYQESAGGDQPVRPAPVPPPQRPRGQASRRHGGDQAGAGSRDHGALTQRRVDRLHHHLPAHHLPHPAWPGLPAECPEWWVLNFCPDSQIYHPYIPSQHPRPS